MGTIRGEEVIARCFKNEGVDTVFFMMGGPTSGTAGACIELGMTGIYVRHEQAAAMAAHAYARVTGKPGICITPSGPGTANAVTGLANAWADASPIVAIGGSAPMRGVLLDSFQEMDQLAMMRPVVLTGSGIIWSGASEELRQFIDATGIPFFTTPQGRGVVPEDHPLSFTAARSMAFREADVVLVIGARANAMLSHLRPPRFSREAKFINVNIDGREIGHNRGVAVGIVGDAKMVLAQLTQEAAGKFRPREETPWVSQLSAKQRSNEERESPLLHSNQVPIHPLRLCRELREVITRDTILVVDGHEILNFARQSIPIYQAGASINAGPHGCMGVGVPFGIGAQVARPDRQVVVLCGDGAFGWNGMEMDTAIRHKLPIVVVVSNNAGFTSRKTGGSVGRELGWQRYDKLVEALGGYGEFVEQPADIRPALERAFASHRPALVNVCTDPDAQATTNMGFAGY